MGSPRKPDKSIGGVHLSKTGSNAGANKLATVIQERMLKINTKPPVLDFGKIQADHSLRTNMFPISIPPADYLICKSSPLDPDPQPGDSVMVAWVQNDAVVLGVISPAGG